MKKQKARIIEVKIGVKTYWYAQIQTPYLYFFKTWDSISDVQLYCGGISWYKSLKDSYNKAEAVLRDYEELYGIKLDITVVNA